MPRHFYSNLQETTVINNCKKGNKQWKLKKQQTLARDLQETTVIVKSKQTVEAQKTTEHIQD